MIELIKKFIELTILGKRENISSNDIICSIVSKTYDGIKICFVYFQAMFYIELHSIRRL